MKNSWSSDTELLAGMEWLSDELSALLVGVKGCGTKKSSTGDLKRTRLLS
jgi:hypothetical protein